jgi:predicted HicB family RNase H-like nuclease
MWSLNMAERSKDSSRGPMIHVRLDEKTHRRLKIAVAQRTTTIQQLVEDLILREIGGSKDKKKTKQE